MAAVSHDIPDLDRKGLRSFGLTTGSIVAVLFGIFFPWLLERPVPWWPWMLGAILAGWALLAPGSLRLLYRGWMRFGLLMGRFTTPLILGLTFFLIFTPVALVRGLLRRDSMARSLDPAKETYRVHSAEQSAKRMEKPF